MSAASMLAYHPERYRQGRPVIRRLERMSHLIPHGYPTVDQHQEIIDIMQRAQRADIMAVDVNDRPKTTAVYVNDMATAMHYLSYVGAGRNIFHFKEALAEAFRRTDVADFAVGEIRLPYPVVYLSFGPQVDLEPFGDDGLIDGAYVSCHGDAHIQIMLTTRRPPSDKPWFQYVERYYYLSLELKNPEQPLLEVVEAALADELEQSARCGNDHAAAAAELGIASRAQTTAAERAAEYRYGYPHFLEGLRLIVNALAYVAHYSDDIERRWPESTPQSMLDKLARAKTHKERRREEAKILSLGFTRINLCGLGFGDSGDCRQSGDMSSHWRRGHWRLQPHGAGRSLRKRVWIMPVLVRPDKELKAAHIYLAGETE